MTPTVRLVKCNALRRPGGEDSPTAVFSDATVAKARAMLEQCATLTAIANELGCNFRTLSDWCLGKRRADPVRIVVRRIRPESFVMNHQ